MTEQSGRATLFYIGYVTQTGINLGSNTLAQKLTRGVYHGV